MRCCAGLPRSRPAKGFIDRFAIVKSRDPDYHEGKHKHGD